MEFFRRASLSSTILGVSLASALYSFAGCQLRTGQSAASQRDTDGGRSGWVGFRRTIVAGSEACCSSTGARAAFAFRFVPLPTIAE